MFSTMMFGKQQRAGLTDAGWWQAVGESWGGGKSKAGVSVNMGKALGVSHAWRAGSLIAGDVGKIPLLTYQRTDDRKGKTEAIEHPAFRLMRYRTNTEQDAQSFRELLQMDALFHGNGYAFIERSRGERIPRELRWLDPSRVVPQRKGGVVSYVYTPETGKPKTIAQEDMFHLKGLSGDGLIGYSVLSIARETLGLGIAARDFTGRFFGNNSITPLVFETDGTTTKEGRVELRNEWERMQGGENQHRTAVLPRGIKPTPISIPADDAQLLETREFTVREIANIFGVPPHKLGDKTRTSFASLEQENRAYLQESLDRWLCKWEHECWMKLLTVPQQQRDTHFFQFDRNSMLAMDAATRASYNRTALGGAPWETINEARFREGLDPIDDPKANELLFPLNMGNNPDSGDQDQGGDGDGPDEPFEADPVDDSENLSRSAVRSILLRDAGRVATRIGIRGEKAAKANSSVSYREWLDSFPMEHLDPVKGILEPAAVLANPSVSRPAETVLTKARELFGRADGSEDLRKSVGMAANDFAAWIKLWAEEQMKGSSNEHGA